ncbi:MAG: class I tRNA ligase family protein, partial [Anaerolineales bacterium]
NLERVESNRNFANKMWNVGRFVINAVEGTGDQRLETSLQSPVPNYSLADSWIWARLQQLIRDVERLFQTFQYGEAGRQIYDFFWSDFADWYLEIAKGQLANKSTRAQTVDTLARVLDSSLRLLHPFTPFVTEELWGHLRSALRESPISDISKEWPEALIVARWPEPREPAGWEEEKIADFTLIQDSIRALRNFHAENNMKPSQRHGVTYVTKTKASLYKENLPIISALSSTDLNQSFVYEQYKPSEAVTSLVVGSTEIYLNLSGVERTEEDKARLEKELKESQSHIERLEKLLSGDFANKAPAAVVQKERDKLTAYKDTAGKIQAQLK